MRLRTIHALALLCLPAGLAFGQTTSTFTLTSSLNPSNFGNPVTLTATLSPPAGALTVTFLDGGATGTPIQNATMNPNTGAASITVSNLSVGTHAIVAQIGTAGVAAPRNSNTVFQVVNSIFVLTNSPNPSNLGSPVTLTTTLTPPSGAPTVTFVDSTTNTPLGNAAMNANSGIASISVSNLTVGNHQIVASYSNPLNDGVTRFSNTVTQTVTRPTTTTSLASSLNPSTLCQSVILTASVSTSSTITLTGNVTFFDGSTQLGAVALLLSPTGGPATASLIVSSLTVGNHSLTATYNGDQNFSGSTGSLLETVSRALPAVSLTSSPNPSNFNQTVTMTATVAACTPAGTSTPLAVTGTVTFSDGSSALTSANLNNGTATFQTASLTVGTHPLSGRYSGDANYNANTSNTVNQVVGTNASSTALTVTPNPSPPRQTVTLTATVTPTTATGAVTFFEAGTTNLGQANLVNGIASIQISSFAVGTHSLTAVYGGSTSLSGSTSPPVVLTVNKANTTTSLTTSANPAPSGQPLTLTATVAPSGATGQVQFRDGSAVIGAGTLTNGTATFTTSTLTSGAHSLTAAYLGDTNFNASTSTPLTQTVSQGASSTNLQVSPNPAAIGQSVTMIATVAPLAATGSVVFRDSGVAISNNVPLTNGAAIFTTSALQQGTHSLTATYSGDATFSGSTSAPVVEVVGLGTTTTTLSALPLQSPFGQTVNLIVTVIPSSATGTITFRDGSLILGTAPLINGTATASTSTLTVGAHFLTAAYGGDNTFNPSTSPPVTVQVSQASTTTVLTVSPTSSAPGQGVLLNARVTPAAASGTVTFRDGTTNIATVQVIAGIAATTTSSLPTGNHTLTAVYSGDDNFIASTSNAVTASVGLTATTTALSVNPTNSAAGQTVTLTATVTPATATGSVTFQEGTTTLGTGPLNSGTATFTTSGLAPGSHSLTAVYGGDNRFATSTSAPVTVTVAGKANTTTALTVSPSPAGLGLTVTMRATVTSSATGTVPAGTVTFVDGSATLGNGPLTNGVATFTTSALALGTHTLTASYGGDANNNASTSPAVSLVVATITPPAITTQSLLPSAIVNMAYSQTFTAAGGRPPLTWSLLSGSVPGLTLSPIGVLSGTPTTAGGPTTLDIRVTDSTGLASGGQFSLTVLPTPAVSISVTEPTTPADQPVPQVAIPSYPVALVATFVLSFTPNGAASLPTPFNNTAVQFVTAAPGSGGTTTLPINVPPNSPPVPLPAVQIGTVAGTITVRLATLTIAGTTQSALPANPTTTTITVPRLAPIIVPGSVKITNVTSSGFSVFLDASSTPRDLSSANLTFTAASGAQLNGTQFTVSLTSAAAAWFPDTAAGRGVANGGSFSVTMSFSYSGDTSALGSVSVTLTNSVGTSTAVSGGR
ncbi:MAG: Ig-like domain-containing protein [Acidobacteriia bacterium]|nr:Ig-like domain-containing protein [Terriglobia bacterium]